MFVERSETLFFIKNVECKTVTECNRVLQDILEATESSCIRTMKSKFILRLTVISTTMYHCVIDATTSL